jgi:hypothetical protein
MGAKNSSQHIASYGYWPQTKPTSVAAPSVVLTEGFIYQNSVRRDKELHTGCTSNFTINKDPPINCKRGTLNINNKAVENI